MLEKIIAESAMECVNSLYSVELKRKMFWPSKTNKEFIGDFTIVVFPLLSYTKTSPVKLANDIGEWLVKELKFVSEFNIIKGFLNIVIENDYWIEYSINFSDDNLKPLKTDSPDNIMVEFSSPNTNKPLHLGHIRNNLLGVAISNILSFVNVKVTRVSLLNDRGIHICKSMLAWEKWGNNITPELAKKKGDHLIGDFYVKFENEYKNEVAKLVKSGLSFEDAAKNSPLLIEAQKLLKKWERGNKKVIETWSLLNSWVTKGFEETYQKLGVEFDKVYLESDTYLKGKDIILKEMSKGTVKINEDNSVSVDLTDVGLDEKILLRGDGTTVYITQDIGTAVDRYKEYKFDKIIYVVGNEQIYHFKVLKEVLKKFGYDWYNTIEHFSYGMVELPEGKMKSREGKVVDADDLIADMINTASLKAKELGKLENASELEFSSAVSKIALGALKYFILRVDPRKNMMFNPNESIDFNGNTGPFIQYTFTRINSLVKKAEEKGLQFKFEDISNILLTNKELDLIKEIYDFRNIVEDAANSLNPATIANFIYNLAKSFNSYYQETPILKEEVKKIMLFRLKLASNVALTIKVGLSLLGIEVPDRM